MIKNGVLKTELLHNGHFANAVVWKHSLENGKVVVEKDFSSRYSVIRNTIGRFLIRREVAFLHERGAIGIVPGGVVRSGPFSMVEDFCDGVTLREIMVSNFEPEKRERKIGPSDPLSPLLDLPTISLFTVLEEGIRRMHGAGIVHLDLHNARNILLLPGDRWVVIDWQSAIHTRWMPRPIRRLLELIDLSGVYKHWEKAHPGTLGPERKRILDWENKRRRLWLLHGLKIDAPPVREK